ncbi:MAG TPA: ATP-dependent DNA ligase [Actinomycetes bacterium]|nr:ATP-dependent DNA ligase [Actinomycetes bacterium]
MLLADVAQASRTVAATSRRSQKSAAVADCLRRAGAGEVPVVVAYLSGELRQRRTGVGWASLREVPPPVREPTLLVAEVDATLETVAGLSGPGSQTERLRLVTSLFARATEDEQRLLRGLLTGELRQGALEGVRLEAVAQAAALPAADVRRAVMLRGAVGPVAEAALARGAAGLAEFRLQVGRPVQPMLASPGDDVEAALDRLGTAALEWKLDGVRVQVHRDGDEVAVFTRSLDDITDRVPEVVEAARSLPVGSVVLDGEAIALRPDGRPRPFQETGSRVGSRVDVARAAATAPLSTYAFDVLHLDGEDVLARSGRDRFDVLAKAVPQELRVPRIVTADKVEAAGFVADTLRRGHEGVVAKSLDAPYEAGRRGAGWLKVKPRHTLDLVVLAAEWGHGRRRGWLSNLHLGARDPGSGEFVMLGKTFKGLTDSVLRWQTERFLELETHRDAHTVYVDPVQLVEIAFDGVQRSSRYPGGVALRFARVIRYRDDKPADEADTIDTVRGLF